MERERERESWALRLKQQPGEKNKKKAHVVMRAKNPERVIHFTSLSRFDSYPPLQQSAFHCGGNGTNNHVVSTPTVSKCCAESFKRLLNFITNAHRVSRRERNERATASEREREREWMTSQSFFLKEQYLGCTFLSLAPGELAVSLKEYSPWKMFL